MKRRLVGVLLLTMMVVAFGGTVWASETATGSSVIKASVVGAIAVEQWPDAAITLGSGVVPGVSTVEGPFSFMVKCNSTWGIQVSSDDSTGILREFDTASGQYVVDGKSLKYPLQWAPAAGGTWATITHTPASVYSSQPKTGEAGSTVDIYYRVTGSFDDEELTDGHVYQITVMYTAGVSY